MRRLFSLFELERPRTSDQDYGNEATAGFEPPGQVTPCIYPPTDDRTYGEPEPFGGITGTEQGSAFMAEFGNDGIIEVVLGQAIQNCALLAQKDHQRGPRQWGQQVQRSQHTPRQVKAAPGGARRRNDPYRTNIGGSLALCSLLFHCGFKHQNYSSTDA